MPFQILNLRRSNNDGRWFGTWRLTGGKNLSRAQSSFAVANLSHVDEVSGPNRHSIEHDFAFGDAVVAFKMHIDVAGNVLLAFINFVNDVQQAGFFEESGLCVDL